LGLMPKTIWHGKYEACGGYIVVQETGDLVSYHLIRKNLFEDYLYRFTKFETPSSSRHRFASIYEIDGMQFYNLNLQIRFK
ncbi:MAG: HpaII family restriction endonuclease, partial [Akkermansiaceae bacterium]